MNLSVLVLTNFRSYNKASFGFSPSVTVILGQNTTGKTNILEAIQTLAVGKSFRAQQERDMVKFQTEIGRIKGSVFSSDATTNKQEAIDVELVITAGSVNGQKTPTKKYLINGVSRRQIDFIGNLRVVLFSPEDLDLITDSPSFRRAYLNSVLLQTDREYRRSLQSYERGLRQRNKLLDLINEGKASRSQLLFWNQLLISTGSYITDKRDEYIEYVNSTRLSPFDYKIIYDKSIISETRLEQYKDEEIAAKSTLVGPQRDDLLFEKIQPTSAITNRDMSRFGSRGEQRLAVLWVKLAELSYIEQAVGERPILLLDDIFSELDETSRAIVLTVVTKQQTIVTSADPGADQLFVGMEGMQIVSLPQKTSVPRDR